MKPLPAEKHDSAFLAQKCDGNAFPLRQNRAPRRVGRSFWFEYGEENKEEEDEGSAFSAFFWIEKKKEQRKEEMKKKKDAWDSTALFQVVCGELVYVERLCQRKLWIALQVLMQLFTGFGNSVFPRAKSLSSLIGSSGLYVSRNTYIRAGIAEWKVSNPVHVKQEQPKQLCLQLQHKRVCRGYMFALEVTEELDSWPEQDTHEREWVSILVLLEKDKIDVKSNIYLSLL
ncbi:hypothetical protein Vadar_020361 [Vaccinium darrowii]|uniref:Uncharacterized protein n=1 Tax=Vaccinium darrowii TaxID=229202 RepID=A0ACB7YX54_9ERIC|nr:hypothetical protein Vadar_020361 [Vaccinium darrowii]